MTGRGENVMGQPYHEGRVTYTDAARYFWGRVTCGLRVGIRMVGTDATAGWMIFLYGFFACQSKRFRYLDFFRSTSFSATSQRLTSWYMMCTALCMLFACVCICVCTPMYVVPCACYAHSALYVVPCVHMCAEQTFSKKFGEKHVLTGKTCFMV